MENHPFPYLSKANSLYPPFQRAIALLSPSIMVKSNELPYFSSKSPIKKPKPGYIFFSLQRRAMLRDEMPGLSVSQSSQVIGGEWRDLSETERAPYEEMAAQDRRRYQRERGEI